MGKAISTAGWIMSIQRLIDEGVSPQNIIYVSVETPIYNNILLELLFTLAKQILGKEDSKEKLRLTCIYVDRGPINSITGH